MSNLLHYRDQGDGEIIILIHGLFGSLDNLGLLARDLIQDHRVISVDLRNHGQSFHSQDHSYLAQATDVLQLLNHLDIKTATVIGHSMGGKVAMKLSTLAPDIIHKLIVMDMAPVPYQEDRHSNVFAGIAEVETGQPSTRAQAIALMANKIEIDGVRQFLSKSLYKQGQHLGWRFNHQALKAEYKHITGWESLTANPLPALFIKGADSDYIKAEHQPQILAQFPNARAHIIANTGHWLHAEKPAMVLRTIRKFLNTISD
ncbi:alpha/beta fold hydrolase [Vibrio gallicus]|uniref:alpha/beta fold hydrolase n=1 Tax=Vibrio gallicus TaxID=190897 RepID=UPI0021C389C8|nr:alpha/beta fold hydrolase [Vibrio gallicus]